MEYDRKFNKAFESDLRMGRLLRVVMIICACLLCVPVFAGTSVDEALSQAGDNRAELQKVLDHYDGDEEPLKLRAAEFLIANMPYHGYVEAAWVDSEGNEIEYDSTDYGSYEEALAAFEELEKEHGSIEYKRRGFIEDVETVSADYLIKNIDAAFDAWKSKPWAKDLSFGAFCDHILPYRCSNEPVNSWRGPLMERYADLAEKLEDPTEAAEAAKYVEQDVHRNLVKFDSIYYLHPTDQGYEEMLASGKGRCEDISNMISYAMRANCIAVASDYTPAWANRDNNHAWNAVLDAQGRGSAGLANIPAKVYRKTFAIQPVNPVFNKLENEEIPRWLGGRNYLDVTEQYLDAIDVAVELETSTPENCSYAYLCVFNGGRWVPIATGTLEGKNAKFENIGKGIVYLPVFYTGEIEPAASPFTIDRAGEVRILYGGEEAEKIAINVSTTKKRTGDDDTRIDIPSIKVQAGNEYEAFYWDGEWVSVGKKVATGDSIEFESLPADRLYWVIDTNGRKLERVFTINNGKQRIW